MATVPIKRSSYTVSFKLKVIDSAEKSSNRRASREYGVNEKLVRDWRKKKNELLKMPKTAKSARPGMKPHWPELEEKLHQWVLDKRMNGIGVSGTMIRLMAKKMANDMPPEETQGFTGSTSWLYRFMKRKINEPSSEWDMLSNMRCNKLETWMKPL